MYTSKIMKYYHFRFEFKSCDPSGHFILNEIINKYINVK